MFRPIKAIKNEIHLNVATFRVFRDAYRYEKMISDSKAKLEETKLVPGVVQIYA